MLERQRYQFYTLDLTLKSTDSFEAMQYFIQNVSDKYMLKFIKIEYDIKEVHIKDYEMLLMCFIENGIDETLLQNTSSLKTFEDHKHLEEQLDFVYSVHFLGTQEIMKRAHVFAIHKKIVSYRTRYFTDKILQSSIPVKIVSFEMSMLHYFMKAFT